MNGGAGAFSLTVGELLRKQAGARAGAMAIQDARGSLCYLELDSRVNRLANALGGRGVAHGDRVAILSENRAEYIELELAAARLGAIVACLNWRLADGEMLHCIRLTTPRLVLVSQRYVQTLARIDHGVGDVVVIDDEYEALLAAASDSDPAVEVQAEDALVILYTSGTTGFPKGAVISHRAMVARAMCFAAQGVSERDTYLA